MYANFSELKQTLSTHSPKRLVVAAAHDLHTLEAVYAASKAFPIRYCLVGNPQQILELSQSLGQFPSQEDIVPASDNQDCARKAVALIREGQGDLLMKGMLETGTLLKAVLDKEHGIRASATMSHLAVLECPGYHKLIAVTDGGMIPYPTLQQKTAIVQNAVDFFHRLGIPVPKVAALSASESVSDKMPDSADAAELQKIFTQSPSPGCLLEGPLSFDLAISKEAATIKGISSQIAGEVDILLVPNITTGNVLCKSLLYWANSKMAGCVLGARVPIVLVSRGATAEEKLLSIMLCLSAQ